MLVIVTYDVSTETMGGSKRLRRIAKCCEDYGQRVQKSVFECDVDSSQFLLLKNQLLEIMDGEEDSIRFYKLGKEYKPKIEKYGKNNSYDPEDTLII